MHGENPKLIGNTLFQFSCLLVQNCYYMNSSKKLCVLRS